MFVGCLNCATNVSAPPLLTQQHSLVPPFITAQHCLINIINSKLLRSAGARAWLPWAQPCRGAVLLSVPRGDLWPC